MISERNGAAVRPAFVSEAARFRRSSPINAMSVDVEEYFQVSAFSRAIDPARWDEFPSRVERNVRRILEIFADRAVRATFFTLGWIARKHPHLVREIVAAGHELASHGMSHVQVFRQSPEEFRADVNATKKLLEDIGGREVIGYRAASYSINGSNLWAFDVLAEAGYRYSSSVYPIVHDLYGMPEAPRFAFRVKSLLEVPVSTVQVFGRNWPCGGGGYFRLLPYSASRWAMRRVNERDQSPLIFYFHPWEIDPEQPRVAGADSKARFRHYTNLAAMESRLRRLTADFRWDRMDAVFELRKEN